MPATLPKNDFLALDEQLMTENLIDPNWREKPTHRWEDVYDELCKDLGRHYGLNDIREAK